jgi:hypothetical protein
MKVQAWEGHAIIALAAICAMFLATSGAVAAPPRNDYLLILDQRTGPYRYLQSFEKNKPDAYSAALAAFGSPNRFRNDGNLCHVTWLASGVTVGFASVAPTPCAVRSLFTSSWYGMSLFGRKWHNRLGLHVGDTIQHVRRLYPGATFEGGSLLALLHRRDQELVFTRLAVKINRLGRVTSIEVPADYIY